MYINKISTINFTNSSIKSDSEFNNMYLSDKLSYLHNLCKNQSRNAKVIVDNQNKMLKSFSNMARQIAGDNIELQANLWKIEKNTKLDNII